MAVVVPADDAQLVFGEQTDDFLTKVCSAVASVVPATSHPDPGSGPSSPIASISINVPEPSSFANPTASSPLKKVAVLNAVLALDKFRIAASALEFAANSTSQGASVPVNATVLSGQFPPLEILHSS